MKKRKLQEPGSILRVCLGSLLALVVLTSGHSFTSRSGSSDTAQMLLWSAAPEGSAYQPNTLINPQFAQWRLEIWLPADFVVDDGLLESAQGDNSAGSLSAPLSLTLPAYVIGLDAPEPEPLPVGSLGLLVLGFGAVGFFFGAPAAAKPLFEHRFACGPGRSGRCAVMTGPLIQPQQNPDLQRCRAPSCQGFPYMPAHLMPDIKNGLSPDFDSRTVCYYGRVVKLYDQGRNRRGRKE